MKKFFCLIVILLIIYIRTLESGWEQCTGPYGSNGGIFNSLLTINEELYAGTDNGIYISNDIGETWTLIGLTQLKIYLLLNHNNIIYAGTEKGLLKSYDNGENWIKAGFDGQPIKLATINENNLYVVYDKKIYVSNDNGDSYNKLNVFETDTNIYKQLNIKSIEVINNDIWLGTYYYGKTNSDGRIYHSKDYGSSWKSIYIKGVANKVILCKDNIIVFSSLMQGSFFSHNEIYVSNDNGETWQLVVEEDFSIGMFFKTINGSIYLTGYGDILLSTDCGIKWQKRKIENSMDPASFTSLAILDDTIIIGTKGEGIYKSIDNGYTWTSDEKVLSDLDINTMTVDGDNIFAAGNTYGLYHSTNQGDTWKLLKKNVSILSITTNQNEIYIGAYFILDGSVGSSRGLYFSSDYGKNWERKQCNGLNDYDNIINILLIDNDKILIATRGLPPWGGGEYRNGGIYLSNDKGENWIQKTNGIDISNEFHAFGFTKYEATLIVSTTSGVYYSNDFGDIWQPTSLKHYASITRIDNILYAISYDDKINKFIYMSTDKGKNWHPITFVSQDPSLWLLTSAKDILFARGNENDVYCSINRGHSWEIFNSPFDAGLGITSLAVMENKNLIFASTKYKGVYRATFQDLTNVQEELTPKSDIHIFPNPTSDFLHIHTDALITHTELTDILGRTVFKQSGNVEQISTAGLAPGLYLLKLYTAGGEVLTQKVVINH